MEDIFIKFEKKYIYHFGDDEPFRCRITLFLPINKSGNLIPILRNRCQIFDWWLSSNWGEIGDDMRYASISLKSSTSWDDLSQEVNKMVEKTISQLREIIFENNHFLVTRPGDEVCIVNLTKGGK